MLTRKTIFSFVLSAYLASIAACGGSSDKGSAATATNGSSNPTSPGSGGTSTGFGACVAGFANQRSTASNSCTNCSSSAAVNANNAIDGVRDTYAAEHFVSAVSGTGAANAPVMGTATFTATAQTGITFPAGEMAGAIVRFPGGTGTTGTITFTTLLSGVTQEAFTADNGDTSGTTDQILLHKTTKAFDAVSGAISVTGPDGQEKDVLLYEFCS